MDHDGASSARFRANSWCPASDSTAMGLLLFDLWTTWAATTEFPINRNLFSNLWQKRVTRDLELQISTNIVQ